MGIASKINNNHAAEQAAEKVRINAVTSGTAKLFFDYLGLADIIG
jgi:hypothetical protein